MRRTVPVMTMLALVPAAWGQQAVSARAGLIQYVEGSVLLDDKLIAPKVNEFIQVEKGQTLATQDGRSEILLTPGAFLRLSENSSFKLISGSLSDTRLEVLSGSAMVEVEELLKDNSITLQAGNTAISLKKHGLYRIDAEGAGRFRVYDGEAVVTSGDQSITARKGREVELDDTLAVAKFDVDATDPFYRWSERRAGYIATANVSSARSVMNGSSGYGSGFGFNSGLGYGGLGYGGLGYSNWVYNPWFGMYTFVPLRGFGYSPFGYALYSPVTVQYIMVQPTTSYVGGTTQRTISPPTARTAATALASSTDSGRMAGGGGNRGGGNAGGSIAVAGGGGGGGGTAASRSMGASAPAAAPAAAAPPAAVSSGGGSRGR